MTARLGACLLFSFYNNWTDWRERRVRNRVSVLFALLGLIWNSAAAGWHGLVGSLIGGTVMLAMFPLFALRMLGAGDVKALIAIGLTLGFPQAGSALVYSLLGGGVAAAGALALRRNGRVRLRRLWTYLKCCWLSGKSLPYETTVGGEDGGFRFTFGITLGLLALLLKTVWKG